MLAYSFHPQAQLPLLKLIKVMSVTDNFKGHLPVPSRFSEQGVIHATLHQNRQKFHKQTPTKTNGTFDEVPFLL